MSEVFDQDAEVPDIVWLDGNVPIDSFGECDHGCWHKPGDVIAIGSGPRTDKLVACKRCGCRVWFTKSGIPATRWQKISGDDARMPRRRWRS